MKILSRISILIIIVLSVQFVSCKQEGCTDPRAVNYNITADKDDGSCIICNTQENLYDNLSVPLVDKKTNSIHYNDTVGYFHLDQFLETPNDKACGVEISRVYMKFQGNVAETMFFQFNINSVSGPVNIFYNDAITVSPYGTVDFEDILTINFPPFEKIGFDSLVVNTGNSIQYF